MCVCCVARAVLGVPRGLHLPAAAGPEGVHAGHGLRSQGAGGQSGRLHTISLGLGGWLSSILRQLRRQRLGFKLFCQTIYFLLHAIYCIVKTIVS